MEEAINILKEKSHSPELRLESILQILDDFDQSYLPIFDDLLKDETEHPDVRGAIALSLGKMGQESLTEPILEILLSQAHVADPVIRNYVIQGLARLEHKGATPALIDALKDSDNNVFASAAEGLGRIGRPAVPYLIELLSQGAEDARCVAAWQLGELGYQEAAPALCNVVKTDANVELVALSIWALGEIEYGSPEVLEVLKWAKVQEDPDIRLRAEVAIKKVIRHAN